MQSQWTVVEQLAWSSCDRRPGVGSALAKR
jgi:hypothetical protein